AAVRGLQPPRDGDRAAELAGRQSVMGPGTTRPDPLRPRLWHISAGHPPRAVHPVGTLGGGRRREPRHVFAAGVVPLADLRGLLGNVTAGRARLRGTVPFPVPAGSPQCSRPAVLAQRPAVLRSGSPVNGP